MNGIQAYNKDFFSKIERMLKGKPSYLRGFSNSLNDLAISSRYSYLVYVMEFMDYMDKEANQLTYDDFLTYLSKIQYKGEGIPTTSSYRIAAYSALKRFSTYLYDSKKINENYMLKIKRPRAKDSQETIDKREKGFLTKREIKKYIEEVKNGTGSDLSKKRQKEWELRDELIVKLFLCTGIRCSALMKLDVDSLDLRDGNRTLKVTDKGDKIREFNLPLNIIFLYSKWCEKRKEILGESNERALFISNQKKRMNQRSISRVVNKYASTIKGKHITPHKLRATYGTQIYNETKDIVFTQECMGHSSSKTTELYIRGNNNATQKASKIMETILQ